MTAPSKGFFPKEIKIKIALVSDWRTGNFVKAYLSSLKKPKKK